MFRIDDSSDWTKYSVTYNNVGTYDVTDNKGGLLNTEGRTEFDITTFAKGWKDGSYNNTERILFTMSESQTVETWFYSSHQYNGSPTSDNRPYLIVTYQFDNLMDEGIYYIRNRHIDKYLQPNGESTSVNAGLELYDFSGSDAQKWEIIALGDGYYTIKSVQSNLVLSVPNGAYSTYDVQLIQAVNEENDGQRWRIYLTSYKGFAIKPKSACEPEDGTGWSDRTMSVADGNNGNGALVTQRPYVYNNSFKDEWYLVPIGISDDIDYKVENRQSKLILQPEDGISTENNLLELWNDVNTDVQKWNFTSVGGGYYKITPVDNPMLAVTVAEGAQTNENLSVMLCYYNTENERQKWLIYKVPNGIALKAKSAGFNNLVLSVEEGSIENGSLALQQSYRTCKDEWIIQDPLSHVLEDGVYYLSIGSSYCGVRNARFLEHSSIGMRGSIATVWIHERAAQMWRIKNLGNGMYSIRPLHKLDMGLNANDTSAEIITIGRFDYSSQITDSAEWRIEETNSGHFILKSQGDNDKTLTRLESSSSSDVFITQYTPGNANQLWTLTLVASENIPTGILFYNTSDGYFTEDTNVYVAPGQEISMTERNLAVSVIDVDNISQNVLWSVSSDNSEYLRIWSFNGKIKGLKYKPTAITITCHRTTGSGEISNTCEATVTVLKNGTYFLNNKENGDYAKVKNGVLVNNQNAVQFDFDVSLTEKWDFNLDIKTGYYTIASTVSTLSPNSSPFFLQVLNNSTLCDADIVVKTKNSNYTPAGMKWKVVPAHGSAFKIIPKTGESPDGIRADYVLATGVSTGQNNVNLVQGDYIDNNSYRDEWYIIGFCDVRCFGIQDPTHTDCDHTITFPTVRDKMANRGYSTFQMFEYVNPKMLAAFLTTSKIVVTNSHGEQTAIILNNSQKYTTYMANSLPDNSLNEIDLILFVACETGKGRGGANNLVNAVSGKGAQIVLGFEKSIYCHESDIWVNAFFEALDNGNKVSNAIDTAHASVRLLWKREITTDPVYSVGNTNVFIHNN